MGCYDELVKEKRLIETNPYLRNPEQYRKALIQSVASSTAIETGAPVESIVRMLTESGTNASTVTAAKVKRGKPQKIRR